MDSAISILMLSLFLAVLVKSEREMCSHVTVQNRTSLESISYAPGNCIVLRRGGRTVSRRFQCEQSCGGDKTRFQEFDSYDCDGEPLVDKMIKVGEQLIDGDVKAINCSLNFCWLKTETFADSSCDGSPLERIFTTPTSCVSLGRHAITGRCGDDNSISLDYSRTCQAAASSQRTLREEDFDKCSSRPGERTVRHAWNCDMVRPESAEDLEDMNLRLVNQLRRIQHEGPDLASMTPLPRAKAVPASLFDASKLSGMLGKHSSVLWMFGVVILACVLLLIPWCLSQK